MKLIYVFLTLVFFLFLNASNGQNVITIQRGSTTLIENRLDSAVSKAQSGDVIYLPGGLVSGASSIIINKKLSIIGAGYHPDSSLSTGTTQVSSALTFSAGAEGSFVSGIYSSATHTINCSNIVISRCNLSNLVLSTNALSMILIEENICRGDVTGRGLLLTNVLLRKNIVFGSLDDLASGGVTCSNNIFIRHIANFQGNSYLTNCLFQNNIFLFNASSNPTWYWGSNNHYANNLFVCPPDHIGANNNTQIGNIFSETLANIFTNYTSGSVWSKTLNFHLKVGCNGIGLGTDGTDVGIYGSTAPFKDGGLPFNPHFKSVSIPNSTSPDGKLNINITVQAQQN